MRSRTLLSIFLAVVAAGLILGCNTSKKDHSARGGTTTGSSTASSSSMMVGFNENYTLTVTGSNGISPTWGQPTGSIVATFPNGTSGASIVGRSPANGPAGWIDHTADVHHGGPLATVSVLFDGVSQHLLEVTFTNNAAPTADTVNARFYRADGTSVTGNLPVHTLFTGGGVALNLDSGAMILSQTAIKQLESSTALPVDLGTFTDVVTVRLRYGGAANGIIVNLRTTVGGAPGPFQTLPIQGNISRAFAP